MAINASSGIFSGLSKSASSGLHRIFGAPNQVLKLGQEIRLDPRQIPLASISAAALIYSQGRENAKGAQGDRKRWIKLLAEAGAIYTLMATTAGILPILTLGTAAYKSGGKPNLLEKLQETGKITSMVLMGYLGAMTGLNYSMQGVDHGAEEILESLENKKLWAEFNPDENRVLKTLLQSTDPERKALGERLLQVGSSREEALNAVNKHLSFLSSDTVKVESEMNYKLAQSYRKKIDLSLAQLLNDLTHPQIKGRLEGQLDHLAKGIAEGTAKAGAEARQKMLMEIRNFGLSLGTSHSAPIRALRMLNPVFGAMIGATLIGIPLAKSLNNALAKAWPSLRKTDIEIPTDTIWLSESNSAGFSSRSPDLNAGSMFKSERLTRPDLNPAAFPVFQDYQRNGQYSG